MYRTGTVGGQVVAEPLALVVSLLALTGVTVLPAAMYAPVQERQLHPALVAAAAGVTLDLAAKATGTASTVDDRELLERIVSGRRALGRWRDGYPDLAMQRLDELRDYATRICGGTRLYGVVRWMDFMSAPSNVELSGEEGVMDAAQTALFHMTALAYAAPPIVSFRRAPSLQYFRVQGALEVRNFGHGHTA
ncbi:MAG: hypothetical protein V4813_18615 [Gemmatimonadota bacterium]